MKLIKTSIWLLALLNVGLFGYLQHISGNFPDEAVPTDIHPELLQVLSQQALEKLPLRASPSETPVLNDATPVAAGTAPETGILATTLTCYIVDEISADRTPRLLAWLEAHGIQAQRHAADGAAGQEQRYWIYRPSLANAEAAQAKAAELKKMGIEDFYIMQEAKYRYAISFGVFKDEKLADQLLQELKQKGVQLVSKMVKHAQTSAVRVQGMTAQQHQLLQKHLLTYPGSSLQTIACPEGPATAVTTAP